MLPFEFVLGVGLPASFCFTDLRKSMSGQIIYKVKAEAVVLGIFQSNIKHTQQFLICREPIKPLIVRPGEYFKDQGITFCCCIPLGHVDMAATIDKTVYFPGEACSIKLLVNAEDCKVKINKLTFGLRRSVELTTGTATTVDQLMVMSNETQGGRGGEVIKRSNSLHIPYDSLFTHKSLLMSCEYAIVVQLCPSWGSDVVLEIPIQISPPKPASNHESKIVYPNNWVFQSMPVACLQLDNDMSS